MDSRSLSPTTPGWIVDGAPFPSAHPLGYGESDADLQPVFDPHVHLQLEPPRWIKPLIVPGKDGVGFDPGAVGFPVPVRPDAAAPGGKARPFQAAKATAPPRVASHSDVPFPGMAYTASFRVLSDEGVRAMRAVIRCNEKFAKANERTPKALRGLGYRSKFVRDFAYSPEVLDFLSRMSGEPMHPHDMPMNIAQINFGQIGDKRQVDKWHLDSVPYVMVLLLSDATDMQGGKLQVARVADPHAALRHVKQNTMDPRFVDTVSYPGPGHAIFMQGSRIAHGVSPVKFAREPRLTLVNSYQSRNPFAPNKTCYRTFKVQDPSDAAPCEIGRHLAWRAAGKLDYILKQGLFEPGAPQLLSVMDAAAEELRVAREFITEQSIDESPYHVDETSDMYKEMLAKQDDRSRDEVLCQERGAGGRQGGGDGDGDGSRSHTCAGRPHEPKNNPPTSKL